MEPITSEESGLIKQLRENVRDLNLSGCFDADIFYLRWIRAREWQVPRAEEMLRKSIAWRKENDIDVIKKWEPNCASVPVDFPVEICGYSKSGCPIIILPFTFWDVRKGVEAGLGKEMIRYIDQVLETWETVVREKSTPEKPVTQISIVLDMNGLSFWQLASMKTIELMLEIVRRYEANHPEILYRAYVVNVLLISWGYEILYMNAFNYITMTCFYDSFAINASRIFNMLFNIIKPFLSPRTLDKVHIFTTQQNQWVSALLKDIEEGQLPMCFGGTGSTSLKMYQDKENSSMRSRLSPKTYNQYKHNTLNINPEEKVLLTFDVNVPNSKLTYEFRTDYFDIEFSIYKDGQRNKPEVPYDRYPSQMMKISGEIICKTTGQYVAEFNNTYSEIRRSKTLHYNFNVIEPSTKK